MSYAQVVGEAVGPGRRHPRPGGLVEAHGNVKVLDGGPQLVVVRVVPRPVVIHVGTQEDCLESQFLHATPGFQHRGLHVVGRDRRRAEHAGRVAGLNVVVQPVVIGPASGFGEPWVHSVAGGDEHTRRRIEHREVQALVVHCFYLRGGVEIGGYLLGVPRGQGLLFFGAAGGPVVIGHAGHHVAFDNRANVPAAFTEPAGSPVLELRVDVFLPQVHGLHNM